MAFQLLSPAPRDASTSESTSRDRDVKLKQYQLENLRRQAGRVPGPVILASLVVSYIAWRFVPAWQVIAWVLLIAAAVFLRGSFARIPVAVTAQAIQLRLDHMVLLSAVNGAVAGLGSAYFLHQVPADQQTILTMILVGWTAGAVSANAAYARAFFAYTIALMTPLAIAWAMLGTQGLGIAALLVLFLAIEGGFVRDNQRVFRQSFSIRYENEQLIEQQEKQRREILREKDRAESANRAKSRFLAAASHDIRQPLHTISLYSAALSLRKTDERSRELAHQIGLAVASLGSLLDSLLDISKLDAAAVVPEKSLFELSVLTTRLAKEVRPVAQEKGLVLKDEVTPNIFVETDPQLLERILRNLLDNAIKYTHKGFVSLRVLVQEQRVSVEVADSGVGIPPKEQERIYEEFYQLGNSGRDRSQGLGLGLAIVQRLVRLLGLDISLRSTEGMGSTFAVSLPMARRPSKLPAPVAQVAVEEQVPSMRVLVVDDEPSIREGMQVLLETWGLQVESAWDKASALTHDASDLDLVIADFRLGNDETGLDVIGALRQRHASLAAMVISGDTTPERIAELKREDIFLLHKPVAEAALKQAIMDARRGTRHQMA